jgi:TRAP-type mannitol/chloroaromatic compound transport system permease small subunit
VITRFIFSYEQAFMGDLVRFWYAALFLFASAYTLIEEGHVRVDVFYSGFDARKRGWVNALGSLVLGLSFCWVILVMGMSGKSDVINSPILAWETTQTGFGMYVKYLMAGFLAIFALSMMIQFVSYMMDAVADLRGEPGGRDHSSHGMA